MSAALAQSNRKLVRSLGLMASASIMSLMMAGEAQAACTPTPGQPLNNVTINGSNVQCTGTNSGQTIGINANDSSVYVLTPGATLDSSTVTVNGTNNLVAIGTGRSAANLVYNGTGTGNYLEIGGSATNLVATANGQNSTIGIVFGGAATATPGNINLSAPAGQAQRFLLQQGGSLTSSGNAGAAYLLTGGIGNQVFEISGTVAVQGNGLFINAGDGDDLIFVDSTAVFANSNISHTLNGGAGNDRLYLYGSGNAPLFATGIERLDVDAGVGGTRTISENGSFAEVNLLGGTLSARRVQALGLANSVVTLSNGTVLTLDFTTATTVTNSFAGTGTILHNTLDPVTYGGLSGSFSGTFNVLGGTALITSSDAFGIGSIVNAGTVSFGGLNLANTISGTGQVVVTGSGNSRLSGNNSFSGGLDIQGGILDVDNVNSLGTGFVTSTTAGGILAVGNPNNQVLLNNLTGNLALVKAGGGILDLTGTNNYAGGTLINGGAIRVDGFSRLGTGQVIANAGGSLILQYNGAGQLLQTTPFLTGGGSFIKEGSGDVVMNLASTFTGGTIIREGRIGLNNGAALGTGNIQVDSGAELGIGGIVLNNSITGAGLVRKTANNIAEIYGDNSGFTGVMRVEDGVILVTNGNSLGAGTLQIDSGTSAEINAAGDSGVAAGLAGSGVLEKYGSGLVTLTGDGTAFAGTVSITNGALQIAGSQNVGGGTILIGNAGTLRLDTTGLTSLNNAILGGGNVIKTGTGTVFVTGSNAYTGGTDIQQGAIRVTDTSFLGSGPITVQSGAALDLAIAGQQTLNQAVSGAGILRKSDSGDLTLLGNGLTGGVDIVGGRVIVGTSAALGGGPVTTAADTQLVFDNSTTETMANLISGAGALTKDGTGLLVIQNGNSFSGGTIINAGRLGLNNGQGLGSGDVIVLANAILGFGGVTVGNNISGAGQVIKTASNVGTLTGTNSFSGGLDIQGGSVVVNSPAALGSGGVAMSGAGTALVIDYSGTTNVALNNALSGQGALIKDGSGTVVMNAGGNSYSGGTTINAGRIGLNFGDALGTGNVVIGAGASLALGDVTYANNTSGAGQFVKSSAGTTTLTGTNSHSGGIAIQAGTLAASGNAPLGSGAISIAGGAQLSYTNSAASAFSNGLSGAGTFSKLGAGQLTFANNFTLGALNLGAGRTRLNVIGTTNVTVAAGATLDGTGRIVGNLINNGTVAPGNSIGTLTVQGNYTHNSGSVLEVEFDAAGNIDLLDVTGNATLNGGTLRFVSIGGAEGQGGTFLRTGGTLTGTFATVETVGALLPLAVVYEPNRAFMAPSVLTARPSTFNAQSLAAADTALGFIDSIGVGDLRHGQGNRIWLSGFSAWGERSASGTTLAYDHETRGLSGGVNLAVGDAITVGLAAGWAKGDITLGANGGGGDQSSVLGSIHARYSGTGFTLGGGLLYGKIDQDTLRNVSFNGFSGSVSGTTDSKVFGGFAELGVPLGSTGSWAFSANLRGSYIRQTQDAYTESGTSPLRLSLGELKTSTLEGHAGLTAKARLWDDNQGGEDDPAGLDLRIDLGARYLGTVGERAIPVTFAVSNAGIVLQGDTRDTLQGQFGLGLDYTIRSGATFSIGYKGEVGKTDRHAVMAGVSFAF